MKCKCGKELFLTSFYDGMCLECWYKNHNVELTPSDLNDLCYGCRGLIAEKRCKTEKLHTGWICPKCGCIWAPQNEGCDNCNAPQMEQVLFIDEGNGHHADKT